MPSCQPPNSLFSNSTLSQEHPGSHLINPFQGQCPRGPPTSCPMTQRFTSSPNTTQSTQMLESSNLTACLAWWKGQRPEEARQEPPSTGDQADLLWGDALSENVAIPDQQLCRPHRLSTDCGPPSQHPRPCVSGWDSCCSPLLPSPGLLGPDLTTS